MYTSSDSYLRIQTLAPAHRHTRGGALSPNVINAAKRLTSGLFIHNLDIKRILSPLLISKDHTSYCQGRKAPSDQLGVQRGRPNKACAFSTAPSLSFIIYRESVPRQRPSSARTRPLTVCLTMDSRAGGGSGLIVMYECHRDRIPTLPDTMRRGQQADSEGAWHDG